MIHTFINDDKLVIGQYACNNSPKELLPALFTMRCRSENLPAPAPGRNHAQVIWVDSVNLYTSSLHAAFSGLLGNNPHPEDKGVKADLYHLVERVRDTFAPGHSLADQATPSSGRFYCTRTSRTWHGPSPRAPTLGQALTGRALRLPQAGRATAGLHPAAQEVSVRAPQ